MIEDFVTFELAKKLKDKGFNKCVHGYYWETGGLSICNTPMNSNALENEFSAPTISQVLKWLREEKKIHIRLSVFFIGWCYDIETTEGKYNHLHGTECEYYSYEKAAIAGIEYVIDNLI